MKIQLDLFQLLDWTTRVVFAVFAFWVMWKFRKLYEDWDRFSDLTSKSIEDLQKKSEHHNSKMAAFTAMGTDIIQMQSEIDARVTSLEEKINE